MLNYLKNCLMKCLQLHRECLSSNTCAGIFSQESSDVEQILCNYYLNFPIFQDYFTILLSSSLTDKPASKIFHTPPSPEVLKNITNIVLFVKKSRGLISNLELLLPERFHSITQHEISTHSVAEDDAAQ